MSLEFVRRYVTYFDSQCVKREKTFQRKVLDSVLRSLYSWSRKLVWLSHFGFHSIQISGLLYDLLSVFATLVLRGARDFNIRGIEQ